MSLTIASTPRATTTPKRAVRTARDTRYASVPTLLHTYDRARDLPRLLPLWPSEIADQSVPGREHIVQRMRRALRQERCRGLAGHWTYDLARHAALLRAYKHELAELERLIERPSARKLCRDVARPASIQANTPA